MKVRSITAFADVDYPLETGSITEIGEVLRSAREALSDAGFEVQTTRLATQPFAIALAEAGPGKASDFAKDLEAIAFVHELDYVALGPVRLKDPVAYIEALPDLFGNTSTVFACVEIATPEEGANLPRIRRCAEVIRRVGSLQDDGFANLRLAALASVPAFSPFFPAAYHGGGPARIAIATESADLAVTAITSAHSLEDARNTLTRSIENEARRIEEAIRPVLASYSIPFQGIDFSLAPYPEDSRSVGAALEGLGLSAIGEQGSLMAAAFLTDALDRAQFKRTGFNGLMLPVFEDSILAQRAEEGRLSISELLMYSAVCGTGLDTLPLPGTISQDSLAAILLDVAALSLRLAKPLTARLMPLPGKDAGDSVAFDFEFFAPSRVLKPSDGPLTGLLAGDESVILHPRLPRQD